jgi:formylglycine-generating enzyme required for sulfatase activity
MNQFELSGDFRGAILNFESQLEQVIQRTGAAETPQSLLTQLRPYLETVVRRSGRLPLGPLDPSGRESTQLDLARVFINLNVGEMVLSQPGEQPDTWLHRAFSAAIAYIHGQRHFVLLGDPGSGKSTLLRFLSFCLANNALEPSGKWLKHLSWSERHVVSRTKEMLATGQEGGRGEMVAEPAEIAARLLGRDKKEEGEEKRAYWSADAPIPIYVELRHFAQTDFDPKSPVALWHYFSRRLAEEDLDEAATALKTVAQGGGVLFLLDGVDEVPVERRKEVWQAVGALAGGPYGGNRWVTTCRVLSCVPDEAPPGSPIETLAQLTDEQIETFIHSWYTALSEAGELGQERAGVLSNQLEAAAKRRRLQGLARNPMLLTIMALVQTYYGTLPDERARLYQQCVETLLLRWQRHKEESAAELPSVLVQLGATQENLERLLWEIGWEAQRSAAETGGVADIPETQVVALARQHLGDWENAGKFVAYTEQRAHLLIGRGGQTERRFTFPHRTFQEYLAACYLVSQRRFGDVAAEVAAKGDAWREVLNLAAGVLVYNQNDREKALDEIERMLPDRPPSGEDEAGWRQVWLAGEMAAVVGREAVEGDKVGRKILPPLREMLVALLEGGRLTPAQRAAAGVALAHLGDPRPYVVKVDAMQFCLVPAGAFWMSSEDEKPLHEVEIPYDYWLGRFPVTNAQFVAFIQDGGYQVERYWLEAKAVERWRLGEVRDWSDQWRDRPREIGEPFNLPNHPVFGVTWYEALAFTRWLTERWQAAGRLPNGWQIRLPTEAEWEKSAKGGLKVIERRMIAAVNASVMNRERSLQDNTDLHRRYPWGEEIEPGQANYDQSGIGSTSAVGAFPDGHSPYGCEELSGIVWEWGQSKRTNYPYDARDGRDILDGDSLRVLRGAAYYNDDITLRCASRIGDLPINLAYGNVGFRVCAAPFFTSER